jgi:hypothetical protein
MQLTLKGKFESRAYTSRVDVQNKHLYKTTIGFHEKRNPVTRYEKSML